MVRSFKVNHHQTRASHRALKVSPTLSQSCSHPSRWERMASQILFLIKRQNKGQVTTEVGKCTWQAAPFSERKTNTADSMLFHSRSCEPYHPPRGRSTPSHSTSQSQTSNLPISFDQSSHQVSCGSFNEWLAKQQTGMLALVAMEGAWCVVGVSDQLRVSISMSCGN